MVKSKQYRKTKKQTRSRRGGSGFLSALSTAIVPFGLLALQKRRQNGRSIKKMYRRT